MGLITTTTPGRPGLSSLGPSLATPSAVKCVLKLGAADSTGAPVLVAPPFARPGDSAAAAVAAGTSPCCCSTRGFHRPPLSLLIRACPVRMNLRLSLKPSGRACIGDTGTTRPHAHQGNRRLLKLVCRRVRTERSVAAPFTVLRLAATGGTSHHA